VLAPADYGLALALAGRPSDAIPVLQEAARAAGADSRVRQNLALAYGLAGDWTEAKTVASQDVPGSLLDSRIQQWMQLATPAKPSDQVAALVGVTPVAVDQGEPAQLALVRADAKLAAAAPAAAPAPAPAPVAAAPEQTRFVEAVAPPPPHPPFAPSVADAAPASQPKPEPVIAQGVGSVTAPLPAAREVAMAGFVTVPKFRPHARHVAVTTPAPIRTASVQRGNSPAVVQLGAYGSPKNVLTAWNMAAHKYAALRAYLPVSARFASPRGIFYRLSVKGFTSDDAARNMCIAVRRSGGNCFVRNIAGDAPVQIAMR